MRSERSVEVRRRTGARSRARAWRPGWPVLLIALATAPGAGRAAVLQEALPETERAFGALVEASGQQAAGAFPFDYQHLAFHDGGPDVDVWAAVSVHAGRVRGVFDGGWKYALRLNAEYFREDSLIASNEYRVEYVLNAQIPPATSDGFPLQTRVRLPPGRYDYRIRVQDLNWPEDRAVNVKSGALTVPAFRVSSGPVISSIAVAADTGGTWNPTQGVRLKLNAAAIVYRSARPYVYFEVYGLTPGGEYRGEIRLMSTWVPQGRGERFDSPRQPFQMQYRGSAPPNADTPVRSVFRLDMTDTQEGPYEVRVRITDLGTGQTSATRTARLKVREIDRTRPVLPITEVRSESEGREE